MEIETKYLSEIAINAAIGLDNYFLKKPVKEDSSRIKYLADYISKVQFETWEKETHFNRGLFLTFWEALGENPIRGLEEVAVQISLFRTQLNSIEDLTTGELEELRDFCTTLSKKSMKYESWNNNL